MSHATRKLITLARQPTQVHLGCVCKVVQFPGLNPKRLLLFRGGVMSLKNKGWHNIGGGLRPQQKASTSVVQSTYLQITSTSTNAETVLNASTYLVVRDL